MRIRKQLDWNALRAEIDKPGTTVTRCLNMEFDLTGDEAKRSLYEQLDRKRLGDSLFTKKGLQFVRFSEMLFYTIKENK